MKNFKFLAMLFCMMLTGMSFVSCSDDDDDDDSPALVGTWEYSSTEDDVENGSREVWLQRYTFNSNNTGSYYEKYSIIYSTTSTGSNVSREDTENFTYIYNAGTEKLILNFADEGYYREYEVMGLSNKELMLKSSTGSVYLYTRK